MPADVIAQGRATFDDLGILSESFDGPVTGTMAFHRMMQVSDSSRAVGPVFDGETYSFAVTDVPRHDTSRLSMRLLVLGDSHLHARL